MSVHSVSVILPVLNQADHIAAVVEQYAAALASLPITSEIILVPNGCSDDTVQICHDLAARLTGIHVRVSAERGWGRAVRLGLQAATGDLLCYTNCARTSAQDLLLLLVYSTVYPNAVVKASRRIRENWRRRLSSLIYNLECRTLFGLSVWDINGTPKAFPRQLDRLLALRRDDELFDAEFMVACQMERYQVLEVPISSGPRHGGKSTTNILTGLRMYCGVYRWRRALRHTTQ
jgi:glycosyltransferase involved in cell wall biosynthesis